MTKIVITGSGGFLGLHLRAAAKERNFKIIPISLGEGFDPFTAQDALEGADKLIHLAGVNRGTEKEITEGNTRFARQLTSLLGKVKEPPRTITYANSIHAENGTAYGTSKHRAAEILGSMAAQRGSNFENIKLPNVFGEYGRPFYNSVVATFAYQVVKHERPKITQDNELQLLHAQNAVDILLGAVPIAEISALSQRETVSGIKELLEEFHQDYSAGEFPDLSTDFRRDLFNTYRSYAFPNNMPIDIGRHVDDRGAFSEVVRSHGGTGQTSFSTTAPGITRGDHYHRRKVERFTVLAGEAEINLRRVFDNQVFTYRISGDQPKSVDMPTLYTHNIRNIGAQTLYTAFWTNDIFDPANPDTISEVV